jgi:hypothetical protein
MPSFDTVNYSLRPSKTIQRQLVFEGMRALQAALDPVRVYIGLGSIWFTDFIMAHKLLSIDDMVSIESNEVGYCRALFNSPYVTVRVRRGFSSEVLPVLYKDQLYAGRPWMIWLDYDSEFDEGKGEDIRSIIENAPDSSVLLVTFNGNAMKYGKAPDRPELLKRVFGSVVPDTLSKSSCRDDKMQEILADFTIALMKSIAGDIARPGRFIPAFRLIYKDTTPMITVGGLLPPRGAVRTALAVVGEATWPCQPKIPIAAPLLTMREAAVLQSQLPCVERLSRTLVRNLGFDLEEHQIEAFEEYYRYYPAFAQIVV